MLTSDARAQELRIAKGALDLVRAQITNLARAILREKGYLK